MTQESFGFDPELIDLDPTKVYVCRACLSTRVRAPLRRTVDPRWVHVSCLECGTRTIATVQDRAVTPNTPTEEPTA